MKKIDKKKLWEEKVSTSKVRDYNFDTVSGKENKLLYLPQCLDEDYYNKLGFQDNTHTLVEFIQIFTEENYGQ